jgi:hypothetical protein
VFIEDPLVNSMATFNFTSVVLDEGTTFTFGSWFCIADGAGDIRRQLIDNKKPEAPAANLRRDLIEFIDNLDEMLLPKLAREIKEMFVFDVTSTRSARGLLGSDQKPS